jgi:hypothetical protein
VGGSVLLRRVGTPFSRVCASLRYALDALRAFIISKSIKKRKAQPEHQREGTSPNTNATRGSSKRDDALATEHQRDQRKLKT